MLDFLRRKKKGKARKEEAEINVILGSFPGYDSEDDIDYDPWDSRPEMVRGKTTVIVKQGRR